MKFFYFIEGLTFDMIYFLLTMNTIQLLSMHLFMLETLRAGQGNTPVAAADAIETMFSIAPLCHISYLPLLEY